MSFTVIIDTFIAGAEAKWLKQSALVLLLPHGFDGAGPEHSTCRLERFLQLGNDPFEYHDAGTHRYSPSLPVVNPTTPAQYFHLLRRQIKRNYRKPLIVAAPKGLLRAPQATSTLQDFAPGTRFEAVLDDPAFAATSDGAKQSGVQRVLLCSGKHYYTLVEERAKRQQQEHVAIVRIEELSPFPFQRVKEVMESYGDAKQVRWIWTQEEPRNQGAWTHVQPRLQSVMEEIGASKLAYRGRKECAVPATGVGAVHKREVEQLLKDAFE